jgi:hypothetical protein
MLRPRETKKTIELKSGGAPTARIYLDPPSFANQVLPLWGIVVIANGFLDMCRAP